MKNIAILLIAFLLIGCNGRGIRLFQRSAQKTPTVTQAPKSISYFQAQGDYKILRNDRVAVTVYQPANLIPPELNERGILVDSSGSVSLPLVGRVRIAGLTQPQAEQLLEKKYARYLKNPNLTLEVLNKRVYVLGEVKKAGAVPLDKERTTVIEALALTGGLTDYAKRDDIIVLSDNGYGKMQLRHINLTNFNRMGLANLSLKPNDIVYVQPNRTKTVNITTDNALAPFNTITKIAAPFVSIKTLTTN